MWNCSLKSLPEASGLITAPWQAKRNIANQIHKKVGHLLYHDRTPASFAPFFTSDLFSSYRSLLFYARQEVDYSSQNLSTNAEHNDRSVKLSCKLETLIPLCRCLRKCLSSLKKYIFYSSGLLKICNISRIKYCNFIISLISRNRMIINDSAA